MKNTGSTKNSRNFWRDRNSVFRVSFFLTFALLFVATLVYGYFRYVDQIEEDLSGQINTILDEITPQDRADFDFSKEADSSDSDKDVLLDASSKLYRVYLDNPSRKNGVRALLHHSILLWRLGDRESAENFLTKIKDEHEKSLFAPTATYTLALIFEESGDYEKANDVLSEFATRYPANFLLGEALLTQGRILMQLKQYQQAYDVYQKLLSEENLDSYSSRADIELSYLESMGYGVDITDASLEQSLEPTEITETEITETEITIDTEENSDTKENSQESGDTKETGGY